MSLNPSFATVQTLKESILHTLQNHALPASVRAATIAPQLAIVNQWSDQIPLVLDNSDAPATVNLVFAIRKDLYLGPQFIQCVLGIPSTELPPAFPAFLSMILKLIGAQKTDKDKPVIVKVRSLFQSLYSVSYVPVSLSVSLVSSPRPPSTLTMISKFPSLL